MTTFAPQPGMRWRGAGTAFKSAHWRLACTFRVCWEAGYQEPWFILTALPTETSEAGWYRLRAWIEQGFKCTKRAG